MLGRLATIDAALARRGWTEVRGVRDDLSALGLLDGALASARAAVRRGGGPDAGDTGVAADPDAVAVVQELAAAADPNLALRQLRRLVDALAADPVGHPEELLAALRTHPGLRRRLLAVLGASTALGDHLVRHPQRWALLVDDALTARRPSAWGLRATLLAAVGADPDQPLPWGSGGARAAAADDATLEALRGAYRDQQLLVAARDLSGTLAVEDTAGELADLAAAALEAALAVAAAGLPTGSAPTRLAIIGLGKAGARELNYVSDVDVVFVAAPLGDGPEWEAVRSATRLAEGVIRVCGSSGPSGSLFPVDAGLRPEGRDGPLVRTVASHVAYYRRWARTWEFQALLKARPLAGDLELGRAYAAAVAPLVWAAAERDRFVADVQAMRRRVEAHVPAAEAERQLKLGPGGLRDVEFAVQLLQLVHGRSDPGLRAADTLSALAALRDGGYVGRGDADRLSEAYRWLRTAEHRLQLQRLRRTHTVPSDPAGRRWLARALGLRDVAAFDAVHAARAREVRRLHEKLFYRPLLDAVARLPSESARLTRDSAGARLTALGFTDTAAALRHLEALTTGVSRRAAIQRTLLPVLLGWFADSANPDTALLAFRQVSDALGDTPWYLRLLRDEGATAERLARVLGRSRYATDLLLRAPEAITLLARDDALRPRPRQALATELSAAVARAPSWEQAAVTARALRRVELLRVACADLLGLLDVSAVGAALSAAATATVVTALAIATDKVAAERRGPLPVRIAVVALGRLGGAESGYGSDADALFVHEPLPGARDEDAAAAAHAVAHETRRLLALPAADPPLLLDPGLRPEGSAGALTRSLSGFRAYHARWAGPWEAQALLRAAPCAGDADLARRFLTEVADPVRYPEDLAATAVADIRRLKSRMETERVRAGTAHRNLKLGPGGLSDVEWVAQLLQLRHAASHPGLRVTGTLPALRAAQVAGVLDAAEAAVLIRGWTLAARARNAVMLVTGRAADLLPVPGSRDFAGVAQLLGYPLGEAATFDADLRRTAQLTRGVAVRLLFADA